MFFFIFYKSLIDKTMTPNLEDGTCTRGCQLFTCVRKRKKQYLLFPPNICLFFIVKCCNVLFLQAHKKKKETVWENKTLCTMRDVNRWKKRTQTQHIITTWYHTLRFDLYVICWVSSSRRASYLIQWTEPQSAFCYFGLIILIIPFF